MHLYFVRGVLIGLMLLSVSLRGAWGEELQTIHTQKTTDMVITLRSTTGQWTQGKNSFVLEFSSPATQQAVTVEQATLNTSMPMPGMAPMIAGATLTPDTHPGRYRGTISFPDRGARQVTVTWSGPAGQGSTRFSVPVR